MTTYTLTYADYITTLGALAHYWADGLANPSFGIEYAIAYAEGQDTRGLVDPQDNDFLFND